MHTPQGGHGGRNGLNSMNIPFLKLLVPINYMCQQERRILSGQDRLFIPQGGLLGEADDLISSILEG